MRWVLALAVTAGAGTGDQGAGTGDQGAGKPLGLIGVVGALPPLTAKMVKVPTVKCGGAAKIACCLTRQ